MRPSGDSAVYKFDSAELSKRFGSYITYIKCNTSAPEALIDVMVNYLYARICWCEMYLFLLSDLQQPDQLRQKGFILKPCHFSVSLLDSYKIIG